MFFLKDLKRYIVDTREHFFLYIIFYYYLFAVIYACQLCQLVPDLNNKAELNYLGISLYYFLF